MLFPTFTFAVFFAVVLTVGWSLHRQQARWKLFMLGASYFFYGFWDWRFIGLIVLSTVVNQAAAEAIHRSASDRFRSGVLTSSVVFNLGLLGFFKYYGFFADTMRETFGRVGLPSPPLLHIVLPVAISFFTFQALSYVIDVKRGLLKPAPLINFALYLSFFPHLVAGPIVRAAEFLPQLEQKLDPRRIDLTGALALIGAGLFKKVVISSYLASSIVDPIFEHPGRHSSLELLLGVYGYAVQIYADFSGYTDIAIGIALLLGIRFPQNFDRPYSAVSIQEFWRRWHMTLSNWLRDFLYIPLGGSKGGRDRRDRNLFLTMLLGGLWHGAAWTFVIWGAYQGAGLVLERRVKENRELTASRRRGRQLALVRLGAETDTTAAGGDRPAAASGFDELADPDPQDAPRFTDRQRRWIGRIVTFHFICVGWIFFRSDSVGTALHILWRILTAWGGGPLVTPLLVGTIAACLAVQFIPRPVTRNALAELSRLPATVQAGLFGAFLVLVDVLGPAGVAPFIYFQF
ncbi:MAG: MBOAT family protein [Acidimicrobiales bacterium]|nr:MBOAT family protein [Acidimicrobiales bacterium]